VRLLKRIIADEIGAKLSEKILRKELKEGAKIKIDLDQNNKIILR
ncbi:hypothetical protein NVZ75_001680, partial [Campylobacter upsaliensis]|nr:hypothetical protein [Campylobacter upsaliensis]